MEGPTQRAHSPPPTECARRVGGRAHDLLGNGESRQCASEFFDPLVTLTSELLIERAGRDVPKNVRLRVRFTFVTHIGPHWVRVLDV